MSKLLETVDLGTNFYTYEGVVKALNKVSLVILEADLEYCALRKASAPTITRVATKAGLRAAGVESLLKELGSRISTSSGKGIKSPWIRGFVGETLPWSEASDECYRILERWLAGAMGKGPTRRLLNRARGV